jgi:hypothetical protein
MTGSEIEWNQTGKNYGDGQDKIAHHNTSSDEGYGIVVKTASSGKQRSAWLQCPLDARADTTAMFTCRKLLPYG